jgi:hypothetical protein
MSAAELGFYAALALIVGFLMLGATACAYEAGRSQAGRGYNIFLSVSNLVMLALLLFVLA